MATRSEMQDREISYLQTVGILDFDAAIAKLQHDIDEAEYHSRNEDYLSSGQRWGAIELSPDEIYDDFDNYDCD